VLATQGLKPESWAASVCASLGTKAIDMHAASLCADDMMDMYNKSFSPKPEQPYNILAGSLEQLDVDDRQETMSNNTTSPNSIGGDVFGKTTTKSYLNEGFRQIHYTANGMMDDVNLEKVLRQLEVSSPDCVADLFSPSSVASSDWTFGCGENSKAAVSYSGDDCSNIATHLEMNRGSSKARTSGDAVQNSGRDGEWFSSIENQIRIGSPVQIMGSTREPFLSSSAVFFPASASGPPPTHGTS
jgi:hypothetical protein